MRLKQFLLVLNFFRCILISYAQLDPILNFCSRWQHSSVYKNDMLYIDGGIETFRLNGENYTNGPVVNNSLGINLDTITIQMNYTWNFWTNISEIGTPKSVNNVTLQTPPTGLVRGAFFQGPVSDSRVFQFGGTSYQGNQSFPGFAQLQSSATPLWSYDTTTQLWSAFSGGTLTNAPNYGLSAEAYDQGLAFYLNGQIDNGTSYIVDLPANYTQNLPGMIVIDLNNQTLTNISTPGLPDDTYPRAGGSMQYVPYVGRYGVLVSLGGAYRSPNTPGNFSKQTLATFDQVDVFDIGAYINDPNSDGAWYTQSTSGDIPPARIDSCVVVASAPDNSSHNIYLYGGRDPTVANITLYDDIYVLSIPSFTWTLLYGPGASPRWGHTCHIVGAGNRQLLTLGGSLNKTLDHCDWETRGVALYDLSANLWINSIFTLDMPAYNVTPAIVKTIGGTPKGGATVKAPVGGWNNTKLAAVMSATRVTATPAPTGTAARSSSGGSHNKSGLIAGAVVGSVVGVAIILVLLFCLRRRKQQAAKKPPLSPRFEATTEGEKIEAPGDEKHPEEVEGSRLAWELDAKKEAQELPETPIHELDAEGFGQKAELEEQHGQTELRDTFDEQGRRNERGEMRGDARFEAWELSGTAVPGGVRLGIPAIRAEDMDPEQPATNPSLHTHTSKK